MLIKKLIFSLRCTMRIFIRILIFYIDLNQCHNGYPKTKFQVPTISWRNEKKLKHSLIRGVLKQSCPAEAKNFTNYVFCHPQFSRVTENIENRCAILIPNCLTVCQMVMIDS